MNSELTGRQYEQRSMPPSITDLFPIPNTQTDDVSMFHVEMNIPQQHMAYDHENHTGTCNFNLAIHNGWYNTTIDLTLWEVANKYTIRLYAKDHAGNSITYDHTVKGLFAGVLDFINDIWNSITATLSKAWDAIKSAVDWIVDFIIDMFVKAISYINDLMKQALSGVSAQYTRFISSLIQLFESENQSTDKNNAIFVEMTETQGIGKKGEESTDKVVKDFFEFVDTLLFEAAAVTAFLMAVDIAYLWYSGGLGVLVERTIMKKLSDVAEDKLLGVGVLTFLSSYGFDSLLDAILGGKESDNEILNWMKAIFKVSGDTLGFVYGIFGLMKEKMEKSKKSLGKGGYIGFIMAILGFIASVPSDALNLSGFFWRGVSDIAVFLTSTVGLGLMLLSLRNPEQKALSKISTFTFKIELFIAALGVSSSAINLVKDWQGGWKG